eukprot:380420-Prymnesium_polylepis.2
MRGTSATSTDTQPRHQQNRKTARLKDTSRTHTQPIALRRPHAREPYADRLVNAPPPRSEHPTHSRRTADYPRHLSRLPSYRHPPSGR